MDLALFAPILPSDDYKFLCKSKSIIHILQGYFSNTVRGHEERVQFLCDKIKEAKTEAEMLLLLRANGQPGRSLGEPLRDGLQYGNRYPKRFFTSF